MSALAAAEPTTAMAVPPAVTISSATFRAFSLTSSKAIAVGVGAPDIG